KEIRSLLNLSARASLRHNASPKSKRKPFAATGAKISHPGTAIEITINRDFESYTEEEQTLFLRAVATFLAMTGDVRVISKRSGSVKLTLEVNHDQAARLLRAIRAGVFAEFGATDARVIEQKAVSHAVGAIEQAVVSGSFEPKMPEEPKRPAGP